MQCLCQVMSTVMRRPIAIVNCCRLGTDANNPRHPPAHTCPSRCVNMSNLTTYEIASYRARLETVCKELDGLETVILAAGSTAQLTCLRGGPILPHAPVGYPSPKAGFSVQQVWRENAKKIMRACGYDGELDLLDNVMPEWQTWISSRYLRGGLPEGVCAIALYFVWRCICAFPFVSYAHTCSNENCCVHYRCCIPFPLLYFDTVVTIVFTCCGHLLSRLALTCSFLANYRL